MMQVLNRLFKWNCFKHFINLKNLQGALAKKTKNEFAYNILISEPFVLHFKSK